MAVCKLGEVGGVQGKPLDHPTGLSVRGRDARFGEQASCAQELPHAQRFRRQRAAGGQRHHRG
eukprot:5866400-Alexandrium_andersonii.AAC.1